MAAPTLAGIRTGLAELISGGGTVQRAEAGRAPAVYPVDRINPYFPSVPNLPSLPHIVGSSNSNIPPRASIEAAGHHVTTAISKTPNSLFVKPTGK
jgi:hypothetical protein